MHTDLLQNTCTLRPIREKRCRRHGISLTKKDIDWHLIFVLSGIVLAQGADTSEHLMNELGQDADYERTDWGQMRAV